jgi:hypothetical protein
VASQIEKLRRERRTSLKEIVNEAMRRGLQEMRRPVRKEPFRIKTVNLGKPLIPIDNVAEAIAYAEGEDYK